MLPPANVDPDVINKAVCDWISNYPVLLLTRIACTSHDNLIGTYVGKHHKKILVMPVDFD